MPRFAANLTMLFNEFPLLGRFAAAAEAGFRAVELQSPYGEDLAAMKLRLDEHGLEMVLINLPPGDWAAGERGIACHPDRVAEFRNGVAMAIDHARLLGCTRVNCLAGLRPGGVSAEMARATLAANLGYAATMLAAAGIRLLLEPINHRDMPGFLINSSAEFEALRAAVGNPNLYLQYDCYHMQIMEGDLTRSLERLMPVIGHIQIADVPDRHEPGSGEINFPHIFATLDRLGYTGWVGCEYRPATTTLAGLDWLRRIGKT